MRNYYRDILDRIDEKPYWFDDFGVPRYCLFSPQEISNIYAKEAALAEISCQSCGYRFKVALTDGFADRAFSLGDEIRLHRASYGDPPNVQCCPAGPSMTSMIHNIIEYWSKNREISFDWLRDSSMEGPVSEVRLYPPDTVTEVITALDCGAKTMLVLCTSTRNRIDLTRRLTAALAADARVIVLHPWAYAYIAPAMFEGHVDKNEIGYVKDPCVVTLVSFDQIDKIERRPSDRILVVAGPKPRHDDDPTAWNNAAKKLREANYAVKIELTLSHSACMIEYPGVIIDTSKAVAPSREP